MGVIVLNVISDDLVNDNHVLSQYYTALEAMPLYVTKLDLDFNVIWANKFALDGDVNLEGKKCYTTFNLDEEQCTFCPVGRSIYSKESEVSLIETTNNQGDCTYEITAIPSFCEKGILDGVFEIRKDLTLQRDFKKLKNEVKQVVKVKNRKEIFDAEVLLDIVYLELSEIVSRSIKINDRAISSSINTDDKISTTSLKTHLTKMDNLLANISVMRNLGRGILRNDKKKTDLKDIIVDKFSCYQTKYYINGNTFDYKYDYNIPSKLIMDKTKVELILSNLIDYAMINSSNRSINLLVAVLDESQDTVKLSFKLKNIGSIAIHDAVKDDMNQCFRSNLSLSVIKNLVDNLAGSFRIIPVSGYGIDIEMTLSFKRTFTDSPFLVFSKLLFDSKMNKNKKVNSNDKKHFKILIAEDEAIGRITMEKMLKGEYDIVFAKNGKVAVEKYLSESPDLIIMDIMMPIMNGFDAYDQIERNSIGHIPIIACTAKVINSEKEYLKSYGFDDYIAKPINAKILKEIIKKYLP